MNNMYTVKKNILNYKKGDVILSSNVLIKLEEYPSFFEKDKEIKLKTLDGFEVKENENIHYIKDNNINMVNLNSYTLNYILNPDTEIFKIRINAINHLHNNIKVIINDQEVIGFKNVYGVCSKSNWEIKNTTTLELFKAKKISDSWKYFLTEKERDDFIHWNKPLFSRKMIKELDKNEL